MSKLEIYVGRFLVFECHCRSFGSGGWKPSASWAMGMTIRYIFYFCVTMAFPLPKF